MIALDLQPAVLMATGAATSRQREVIVNHEMERRKSASHVSTFILKIASRCNLNCSYCYVYNKGDSSWASRPAIMSNTVFRAALDRIKRHCDTSGQREVMLAFHGGEPTLVG